MRSAGDALLLPLGLLPDAGGRLNQLPGWRTTTPISVPWILADCHASPVPYACHHRSVTDRPRCFSPVQRSDYSGWTMLPQPGSTGGQQCPSPLEPGSTTDSGSGGAGWPAMAINDAVGSAGAGAVATAVIVVCGDAPVRGS